MEAFKLAAHRPFAYLQALTAGDDRALRVSIIVFSHVVLCAYCSVEFCVLRTKEKNNKENRNLVKANFNMLIIRSFIEHRIGNLIYL